MKKKIRVLLVTSMICIAAAGCGASDDKKGTTEATTEVTTQAATEATTEKQSDKQDLKKDGLQDLIHGINL